MITAKLHTNQEAGRDATLDRVLANVRTDFPVLDLTINGQPLVYLDNAASTQKPDSVIEAVANYYKRQNANVHRGVHYLSQLATS